ncbi:hypothetical protein BDV93DRAFT_510633 [Ceratobasidium sp. AG-I]|nr:hypothetical protein BDV93DRAFT_510633 [Ceratobasidium sp. AG-I]
MNARPFLPRHLALLTDTLALSATASPQIIGAFLPHSVAVRLAIVACHGPRPKTVVIPIAAPILVLAAQDLAGVAMGHLYHTSLKPQPLMNLRTRLELPVIQGNCHPLDVSNSCEGIRAPMQATTLNPPSTAESRANDPGSCVVSVARKKDSRSSKELITAPPGEPGRSSSSVEPGSDEPRAPASVLGAIISWQRGLLIRILSRLLPTSWRPFRGLIISGRACPVGLLGMPPSSISCYMYYTRQLK